MAGTWIRLTREIQVNLKRELIAGGLMNLREELGGYSPSGGPLPPHGLTLHDLGELIRRAGLDADFIVESEFKIPHARGWKRAPKLDWVWLRQDRPDKPIVAFEIEGRNVYRNSIAADVRKFRACKATVNVIALFQVDHNRVPKRMPPRGIAPVDWVKQHLTDLSACVYLDEDLVAPGGIEKLQRNALAAAEGQP